MTELRTYLSENNISVKEFAILTKVKEEKINSVLNNRAFFSHSEATRVSAFLRVSPNEFYHGVIHRKGELPEVAEQNNLNHFRYYIRTRYKKDNILFDVFASTLGIFSALLCFSYIFLMFAGVAGLPTLLRRFDILLPCFIIPVFSIPCFCDISKDKVFGKRASSYGNIRIETFGMSFVLILYSVFAFVNRLMPVESLVLSVLGAAILSALSIKPPFSDKPLDKRGLKFAVCMIPALFLVGAKCFVMHYVNEISPEETDAIGDALSVASDFFDFVLGLFILAVLYLSLVLYYKSFFNGIGRKFFKPAKKSKSIGKGRLAVYIIGCILIGCAAFTSIWLSQGVYLKYMYSDMFAGEEETVNWTNEFITDFETEFEKGECDVVEFEGMKIKIPKGYFFSSDSEYNVVYKNSDGYLIAFQKPISNDSLDIDYFEEYFGDKLTEKQIADLKQQFIDSFGFYPTNYFEWTKLYGTVTLDDVDIFNPTKTALLSTVFIMKAVTVVPDSEYYLYENGDLCARIIIHTIESKNREMVNISFGSTNLEYGITISNHDRDNSISIEEVTKILNSIEVN